MSEALTQHNAKVSEQAVRAPQPIDRDGAFFKWIYSQSVTNVRLAGQSAAFTLSTLIVSPSTEPVTVTF